MTASVLRQLQLSLLDAQLVDQYTSGKSLDDFAEDELLRLAIERLLERLCDRIGLAARALPGLAREFPEVAQIVGFRNRLAHEYDNILIRVVWDIVQSDIPLLKISLTSLLEMDVDRLNQVYGE